LILLITDRYIIHLRQLYDPQLRQVAYHTIKSP